MSGLSEELAIWGLLLVIGGGLCFQLALLLKELRDAAKAVKETCFLMQKQMNDVCRDWERVCRQAGDLLSGLKGQMDTVQSAFRVLEELSRPILQIKEMLKGKLDASEQNGLRKNDNPKDPLFLLCALFSLLKGGIGRKEAP